MNGRPTDHRNTDLVKLHEDVCFGRSKGKIIWQPRILAWFSDRDFAGLSYSSVNKNMTQQDVYRELGCSNRLYFYNDSFAKKLPPHIKETIEEKDDKFTIFKITTPKGTVQAVYEKTPNFWGAIHRERFIKTPKDMEILTEYFDSFTWEWNQKAFDRTHAEWGNLGAPTMFMPRVNVQELYIDSMGVEPAVYAIYEWGDVIPRYFKALHENHLRLIEIINKSPINIINFGDNLHCATLSPSLYEEFVLPAYLDRCENLHKANKFVNSHWDGDVKAILKFAKISGLDGIEAITPKPQGDVTLEEIKEALGDKIVLLDGIPAIYFDKTFSEDTLIECTERLIKLFAPRLVLGVSDEMSATGDLERVKIVTKIVDDYNAGI